MAMTPEQQKAFAEQLMANPEMMQQFQAGETQFQQPQQQGTGLLGQGLKGLVPGLKTGIQNTLAAAPSIILGQGVPTPAKTTTDDLSLWKAKEDYKKSIKDVDITSPEGISGGQQLQAFTMAKKMVGVRKIHLALPTIYAEMRAGKSMDEIEDGLRIASQSEKMQGNYRFAAQSVLSGIPEKQAMFQMDLIDDALNNDDEEQAKSILKRAALTRGSSSQQDQVFGNERTIGLLDEIQDDLKTLEAQGIKTNIFVGTAEDVAKNIAGSTLTPELRTLATKISAGIQKYRRSMSGVAFSVPESEEYKAMFPSISRTGAFNSATIKGIREVITGDLENFYSLSMGRQNYREIFGSDKKTSQKPSEPTQTISDETPAGAVRVGRFIVQQEG